MAVRQFRSPKTHGRHDRRVTLPLLSITVLLRRELDGQRAVGLRLRGLSRFSRRGITLGCGFGVQALGLSHSLALGVGTYLGEPAGQPLLARKAHARHLRALGFSGLGLDGRARVASGPVAVGLGLGLPLCVRGDPFAFDFSLCRGELSGQRPVGLGARISQRAREDGGGLRFRGLSRFSRRDITLGCFGVQALGLGHSLALGVGTYLGEPGGQPLLARNAHARHLRALGFSGFGLDGRARVASGPVAVGLGLGLPLCVRGDPFAFDFSLHRGELSGYRPVGLGARISQRARQDGGGLRLGGRSRFSRRGITLGCGFGLQALGLRHSLALDFVSRLGGQPLLARSVHARHLRALGFGGLGLNRLSSHARRVITRGRGSGFRARAIGNPLVLDFGTCRGELGGQPLFSLGTRSRRVNAPSFAGVGRCGCPGFSHRGGRPILGLGHSPRMSLYPLLRGLAGGLGWIGRPRVVDLGPHETFLGGFRSAPT